MPSDLYFKMLSNLSDLIGDINDKYFDDKLSDENIVKNPENLKFSFAGGNWEPVRSLAPRKIIEGVSKKTGKTTTVVFWNDGTKTKVSNMKSDKPDRYMAFCAALAKKMYGSTDKAQKIVEKSVVKTEK